MHVRNTMKLIKNKRGISLVEALISVVIFAVIAGIYFLVLLSGSDSWENNRTIIEVNQEVRKAMDWMKMDLMQAGSTSISDGPTQADGTWYTSITFKVATGVTSGVVVWSTNTIQYILGGANSTRLLRIQGAQTKTISQDIQSVRFRRQSSTPNIIEVEVAGRKTSAKQKVITLNTSFQLRLRN